MGISWYSGTVASAINEAKRRGTAFIVVITDENGSNEFCSVLETFSTELSTGVVVKYMANSVEARQFGEFYPVVLIPSLYFIDSANGINLETTGGHSDPDKIRISIEKGLKITVNQKSTSHQTEDSQSSSEKSEETKAAPIVVEEKVEEEEKSQSVPSEMEATSSPESTVASAESVGPSLSLEERVARAKELLAKRTQEKSKEEEEKVKNKELERRAAGKSLQKFKEEQEEMSMKRALEERKREKEAERLAREKVKAQIAQDRADKAKKYNAEREEEQRLKLEREKKAAEEEANRARALEADRSKSSRLQFRLPDGRTHTHVFDAEAPLSDVYAYVRNEVDKGFVSFSLSTTFPVKKLDNEDPASSLKSLELAPSATIMILPKSSSSVSYPLNSTGNFMSYIWLLLSPLTFVFNMLQSFFPSSSSSPTHQRPESSNEPQQGSRNSQRPQTAYKRRADGGQVRREGNIARLSNDMDNDDENGTWNGNSTQQM